MIFKRLFGFLNESLHLEQKFAEFDSGGSLIFYIFCGILLLFLAWLTCCYSFEESEENCGIDQAKLKVIVQKSAHAYHYEVIFQVGCPTNNFDSRNALIDFELLDIRLRPLGGQARFMLTDLTGTKLDHFICNLYVPNPLPTVSAVRVSHTNGFPGSGVFLFDVIITCIRGPLPKGEDDPPLKVNHLQNQKLNIFAYILDSPKIYTDLEEETPDAEFPLPHFTKPRSSSAFLKALFWLEFSQTVSFTIILLDNFYLMLQKTILSLFIALAISVALLLQAAILISIHKELTLSSTVFNLLKGTINSNNKKSRNCTCPSNWAYYGNILLWLVLLISIGTFIGHIIWNHKQSLVNALYIEAIFEIVLVIVFCISLITYEQCDSSCCFNGDRLTREYQLISESNRRAQLHSNTSTKSERSVEDNSISKSSSASSSSSHKTSSPQVKLVEGSLEML